MAPPLPITFGAASGRGFGLFSSMAVLVSDPYFEYVTMLLHGDGTNGAQNNTFLDSSTNNFTITRNGDTTQGSFSPFSRSAGNWGVYFSSGALTAASNAAFAVGTGNFTLEAWVYPLNWTGDGTNSFVYSTAASNGLMFGRNGANFVVRAYAIGDILQYGTLPTLNTWTHIVAVRSGTTLSMYYNGTRVATNTTSQNFAQGAVYVGRDGPSGSAVYAGYVSNLRLVNGTAVYDPTQTTLTVPTTPLTAVANTSLLVCQNNRFRDNSTNNFSINTEGSPAVQVFNPFNPTSAYSTSANGGSGYFDGSGDNLSVPNSTSLQLGSADWDIECWVYLTSTSAAQRPISQADSNYEFAYYIAAGGGLTAYSFQSGGSQNFAISMGTLTTNQWYHLATTRNGSTITAFVNGVSVGTASFAGTIDARTSGWRIGSNGSGTDALTGYVSGARIVKGSAVYTTNFTPPTSPPTAITNTSLLLNFTNGGIFDNAAMNDLGTAGGAQVSTVQKKFGTASMYFDGTGDYLALPSTQNVAFGTGDFTIEFWAYSGDVSGSTQRGHLQTSTTAGGFSTSYNTGITFFQGANAALGVLNGGLAVALGTGGSYSVVGGSSVLIANQWQHIALTRSGSSVRLFVDGTQVGSTLTYTSSIDATNMVIGGYYQTSYFLYLGYIDDFRITKGYARYTANFTPPDAAFPNL